MGKWSAWLCATVLTGFVTDTAAGQAIDRPADERPQLEQFEIEGPTEPSLELPRPPPPPPGADRLMAGLTVFLQEVRVEGSTVFTSAELDRITAPWTQRAIDAAELQDLVDAVTALYVESGYLSSGAYVPDQNLEGSVLVLQVVEARLAEVIVEGNRWHRSRYLRNRLRAGVSTPVNVRELEQQLQLLLQEPSIRRVSGELRPGAQRGEDVLFLAVEENRPYGLGLRVANDTPPGIGSVRGRVDLEHRSLLGFADHLAARVDFTGGMNSQEVRYALPFTPYGTAFRLRLRRTDSEVVEEPFDTADIASDTWTVGAGVYHPILRSPRQQLWGGVQFDRRQSTTTLDGSRFSFVPGPKNGRADVSVLRFVVDWTRASPKNVVAARSTVSWGLDFLGATTQPNGIPDGRFVSWLAQAQWAHLFSFPLAGTQLVVRGDLQLSNDPLLAMEQIAVGGARTVRGYRENLLVRDQAVIGSVELRVPVLHDLLGPDVLTIAPFFDVGHAWNRKGTLSAETIESVGIGLRYSFSDRIQARAYWAGALASAPTRRSNIQDNGFHLELEIRAF